jgi:ElaB/YqjD/DUF883 family membrane-anchored ribosome-binding protein
MENEPEVIRERMQENRTALTDKLEALEQQVLGVASTVTNTVENVKEGVQETVEVVKDSVKETVDTAREMFDLSRQVERHPWFMLAGSAGVGFLMAALLRRAGGERVSRRTRRAAAPSHGGNGAHKEANAGATEGLFESVKEGLTRVRDLALGTLFGTVERIVAKELPQAAEAHVKAVVDDVLAKLRGAMQPEKSAAAPGPAPQPNAPRPDGGFDPRTGRPLRPASW